MTALGHGRLLNRCGAIWHKPGEFTQAKVNDAASAKAIRPINSSVIKRPFMVWPDGKVTVGFDASAWFALFQAH